MQPTTERAWILARQQASNWPTFVAFWEGLYAYSPENVVYDAYVANRPTSFTFEAQHLRELFQWKNNMGETLAAKKAMSVANITDNLPIVWQLATDWDDADFKTHFGGISAVWQTFLMHIIQPDRFPIFDQHVYRAYTYLQTGKADELTGTTKQKLRHYEEYRSFFDAVRRESGCNPRHLDKAFWAFGRFLKQYKPLM